MLAASDSEWLLEGAQETSEETLNARSKTLRILRTNPEARGRIVFGNAPRGLREEESERTLAFHSSS